MIMRRTAMPDTPNATPSTGTSVTAAFYILGVSALFGTAVIIIGATRFSDGQLILTAQGCKVLTYHEVSVEPLDDGLCRVKAQYRFASDASRFGTIRADTPRGRIEIEIPTRELVSKVSY